MPLHLLAFSLLDEAYARSELPDEAGNVTDLEEWLVSVRMRLVG